MNKWVSCIRAVLTAMTLHQENAAIQLQGSAALANLTFGGMYKSISHIRAVLAALQHHQGDASVQGCAALAGLSSNAENKIKMASEGGIDTIMTAMYQHEGATKVQLYGCRVLRLLAFNNTANQELIVSDCGGIRAIMADMRRHEENKDSQEETSPTLAIDANPL